MFQCFPGLIGITEALRGTDGHGARDRESGSTGAQMGTEHTGKTGGCRVKDWEDGTIEALLEVDYFACLS